MICVFVFNPLELQQVGVFTCVASAETNANIFKRLKRRSVEFEYC